jgi:hypothetical protein
MGEERRLAEWGHSGKKNETMSCGGKWGRYNFHGREVKIFSLFL